MTVKRAMEYLLSLPRSAYINFRLFGMRGLRHMPILISNATMTHGLKKDAVKIEAPLRFGMIRFGFGGSEGVVGARKSALLISGGGVNLFPGDSFFGSRNIASHRQWTCDFW